MPFALCGFSHLPEMIFLHAHPERDQIIVSQDKGHLPSDELFRRTRLVTLFEERERDIDVRS